MNEKYELFESSLNALVKKSFNLLILKGEPGFSKTHNTLSFLENNKVDYTYLNSYSTPLKFYELLYNNKDKQVIVFDDVQNIDDPKIIGMLKAACWNLLSGDRVVAYYTTSDKFEDLDIEDKFNLKANIILIFNEEMPNFAPIINRGVNIDFTFTFKEKIEIFNEIKDAAKIEKEILDYIIQNGSDATKNLSIRTLVILSNLKRDGFDWLKFAKEILKTDEDTLSLIEFCKNCNTLDYACKEWCSKTGYSRRTFFRRYNKLKITERRKITE